MNHSFNAFALMISARRLTNTTATVEKQQAVPMSRRKVMPGFIRKSHTSCRVIPFRLASTYPVRKVETALVSSENSLASSNDPGEMTMPRTQPMARPKVAAATLLAKSATVLAYCAEATSTIKYTPPELTMVRIAPGVVLLLNSRATVLFAPYLYASDRSAA